VTLRLAVLASSTLLLFVSPAAADGQRIPPRSSAPHETGTAGGTTYHVKPGDTLGAIASRHHVTLNALLAANRLAGPGARLRIGQRLVVPTPVRAPTSRHHRAATASAVRRPAFGRAPAPPRHLVLALPDFSDLTPLFSWPTEGHLSSVFGRRRLGWHRGIDITAEPGTPVLAAAGGTVLSSGYETRYGRVVKIEHVHGFVTVYAHNHANLVEPGDRVFLGQPVAAVGRTGRATAPHVHFEIRRAGLAYNPLYMLPMPPRATLIEDPAEDDDANVDD
jgi:murein DD-endopeptidase MepM/ murein hydrolase activator NlpD